MRNRRGIWFVDNITALMALIGGRSRNTDLDRLDGLIHTVLVTMKTWLHFEWIESASNWSSGTSRKGFADPRFRGHRFSVSEVVLHPIWLHLPMAAMCRVVEIL